MSSKVRKQIYIEKSQDRLLKREAKARGVSEAQLIRRAIDKVMPSIPRGGDRPEAIETLLQFARKRLAAAKKRPAGGKTPAKRTRSWTREDLYEERLARYGKRVSG
jgi:hypothetical protein